MTTAVRTAWSDFKIRCRTCVRKQNQAFFASPLPFLAKASPSVARSCNRSSPCPDAADSRSAQRSSKLRA
eukprot:7266073-Prymnesium_polylepis.1